MSTVDLLALRIRADRVLQSRRQPLEVDMLAQAVYVLCDEVERLRAVIDQEHHVADIREDGWSIEHVVACREQGMLDCPIHRIASAQWTGPPADPGRYEVELDGPEDVVLYRLPDPT